MPSDASAMERSASPALPPEVFQRVGALTRQLHDALTGLGHADNLQRTINSLPDAQDRLAYVARLTGEAAEKVLARVEDAKGEQARLLQAAQALASQGGDAAAWGERVREAAVRTDDHLTEIMLAQDFHDLTGQVIKRLVDLAVQIERQLLELLLLSAEPGGARAAATAAAAATATTSAATAATVAAAAPAAAEPALAGPVVNPAAGDVVTDQSQVDDLLATLGF